MIMPSSDAAGSGAAKDLPSEADEQLRRIFEGERIDLELSQDQLGKALGGITGRQYRNWMVRPTQLNAVQLDQLSAALNLSDALRAAVYDLTGHRPPANPASAKCDVEELAVYRELLHGTRHPSHITDYAWDSIAHNDAFEELFGHVKYHPTDAPIRNGMRYILFHPDANQILGAQDPAAFHEYWLMPALAQFSATLQQRPEDPRLLGIKQEIEGRRPVRLAYEKLPDWIRAHGDLHVRPIPRPFWDPRSKRLTSAHVITEAHLGYQSLEIHHATFVFLPQGSTS